MVMDLSGTTALVTGAGHRVGKGLALALAGAGCSVFVHYNRSATAAEETAAAARDIGVRAVTGSADLGDADAAAGLVAAATAELGPVQVLVNSASGFPDDSVTDVDQAGWNRALTVTLNAPVFLTQAVALALPEDLEGSVLNLTDWRIDRPYPDHFSYTIAKAALARFTESAALALAPRIRVNAVALGAILPPPGKGSDYLKDLAGAIPLRRVGSVEVVADMALALLRNDFVTGEIVKVNGGAHLV